MTEIPPYDPLKKQPEHEQTTVERSVSRDGAFSKPGHVSKTGHSGKWKPATGTRFRATNEKPKGRIRKRKRDPRHVEFY